MSENTYWRTRGNPRKAFQINENENTELIEYFKCDVIHKRGRRPNGNHSDGYIPHEAGDIYFYYSDWLVERWTMYDGERNDLIPEVISNDEFLEDFELVKNN